MSRFVLALPVLAITLLAGRVHAQEAGSDSLPRLTIHLRMDSLVLRRFAALAPGGRLGARTVPLLFGGRWEQLTRAAIARARAARRRPLARLAAAVLPDTTLVEPGPPPGFPPPGLPRRGEPEEARPLDALAQYADIGLQLRARFEMKFDRFRNERCTAVDLVNPVSGCQGGFPTPTIDQQFNVRTGGIIGDRIHLNVDFDSEREFSANNNINVYYEGLEDEILRRVEVGNVSFNAPGSRFITAAIPANSFGVQAEAQLGAFEFRSILAQQKGSQLRERVYTVGERTTLPIDREGRDLDYETGRFFFVSDPRLLPGFPAVDILELSGDVLNPSDRPVQVRIYRLRAQSTFGANPNLGGIDAVAVRPDSPQRVGPFPWELLIEGDDYFISPSGIWFALARRVGDQDFLAVSYVTASGDTVGTFPAANGDGDTLQLTYEPRRGPEVPTFDYEMRNIYRIGSSFITRPTLELAIVVNESEQPLDGQGTYLSRLGVARSNDLSTLDEFNRVFPRSREPNGGEPISDLFLVFPHLRPFADDSRLAEAERNDSLYLTPVYLLNSQGPPPRFRLRLHYEEAGAGDRATLNLGAFQIRDGSEKLFVGSQELVRGRHYEIDYSVGQVLFLNPDSLFRGPTQVSAQFEENAAFDVAPKSIFGLSTTYDLGSRGQIHAIGMLQRESSPLNRPRLGFEPQSNFIGGLSANLLFRPDFLTRVLDALPLISTAVPSTLTLNGEVAFSRPNPNPIGQAYLEEFESSDFRPLTLRETRFQLGSRPASGRGLTPAYLDPTGGFAEVDAVPLAWQNLVALGGEARQFGAQDIDTTIVLIGAAPELATVLWLSLKPDTVGGLPILLTGEPRWMRPHTPGPRWRSISQALGGSGIGVDLSRIEFLEFWALEDAERTAKAAGTTLVFDFGTIFEDAVAPAPDAFTVAGADTVFSGLQFLGQGRLDTERDTLTNIFNAATNDIGIHGDLIPGLTNTATGETLTDFPTCELFLGAGIPVFPIGHLGSRCTRGNGIPDTEDLDGDSRLDITVGAVDENLVRYVFPIGDDRFFVRNGGTTTDAQGRQLTWRLYRIPFREDTVQIGSPNIRQIESFRLTMVAPDQGPTEQELVIALARVRLAGAPWLKRAATPIAGLGGSRGEPHGEVIASVVTTENRDLGYTSPPGIGDQADTRGAAFELATQQINEKSLRLLARGLVTGERAEAFVRFTDEADKNFLQYRKLRVWARGRGPGWEDGDLEFFIKVGRDEHNFYLYRTPVRSVDWEPEVVIDIERWTLLRAQVEAAWLRGDAPSGAETCGGDSTAFVACEGPYVVHVRDPGTSPPNLARVSELAVGMQRVAERVFIGQAELWVDDIRLSDVVDDIGVAGALDVRLQAADLADVQFSFSMRDDRFQQLGETPSYETDGALRIGTTFRLDKLLPGNANFSIPIGVQHTRTNVDPFYLNRSDIRADALPGLRLPRSTTTSYSLSYRRLSRGQSLLEQVLVDPFSFSATMVNADNTSQLSQARTKNRLFRLDYTNLFPDTRVKSAPGFLVSIVDALPGFISNSEFAKSLRASQLRVTPFQLRGTANLVNNRTRRFAYRVPVSLASDTTIRPLTSINHTLRTDAGLALRPFNSLSFTVNWASTRNLQDFGDSTTIGRLLGRQRQGLLGQNVGFEQLRTLSTALSVSPVVSSWLRPRFSFASSFSFNRDPYGRSATRLEGDTLGGFKLPETLANSRRREIGATVQLDRLVGGVVGDSNAVAWFFRRFQPVDVSISRDLRSTFDRAPFEVAFKYQLGFGGLDDFRQQGGVPATSAAQIESRTLGGGLQLPLNVTLRANYRDQENVTWLRRGIGDEQGQVIQRTREWPSGSVSWSHTPRWFLRSLVSLLSVNARLNRTRTETEQPSLQSNTAGSRTENRSRTFGPTVSITWAGGIQTGVQYSDSRSEAIRSGNVTQREQRDLNGNVSFSFRLPLVRLSSDVRSTASYTSSDVTVCLLHTGSTTCTPVSDSHRSAFDVRMDTGLSTQVRGGLGFSRIVNEQRHTSSKISQIIFTIFAEVFFLSGQIR